MPSVPSQLKIFHITHVDNLRSIIKNGGIFSDAMMSHRGGPQQSVGMSRIKQRRLQLPVSCHPGDMVGDYVPFYFCPRSVMLYILHRGNHPGLNYRGGQGPILHLQVDVTDAIEWAGGEDCRWVICAGNAGAVYATFEADARGFELVDWDAVQSQDFTSPDVKEGKQAEFLVHAFVPWTLIERIGVMTEDVHRHAGRIIAGSDTSHHPVIDVRRDWYF